MDADVGCKIGAVNRFRLQRSVMMGLEGGKCMVWVFLGGKDFDAGFVVLLVFFCVAFGEFGEDVLR